MMKWTSVEESLPDFDMMCFLVLEGGNIIKGHRWNEPSEGWFWCNSYGSEYWDMKAGMWKCDGEADDDYQVTYWMPLPDPPK